MVAISVAVTAGALTLSGCASSGGSSPATSPTGGGSTPGTSPAGGGPTVGSAPSTAANSAASLVPASIRSDGTLSMAMDATYPPDEYIASDGKTILGMDADLGNALAKVLGLKAKLMNVKFDGIIPGLADGKYDVGLSSFTDNKEREKTVDFVTYFQAGEGYYVKAGGGKSYNGLGALCGAKVAVENGTTEQTDAQAQAKKCASAGKSKVTVLSFSDQNGANLAVSSGRADLGFADSQVVDYIVKQSNGQFQVTGKAFEVAPYGIALPQGNGMAKAVLAAMTALIGDGTYSTILKKWGVEDGAITTPVINGATS